MSKKIVILGGGYGGVLTAKKLAKKFKKDKSVEITLIDKHPYHTMMTELHEVAADRVEDDSIRIDLKKIFAKRNVNVVLDEITQVDFKEQVIASENRKYQYDYLVVGTGCKPAYFGIEGAEENSHPLWSFDDAVNLKQHIISMFRKAMKEPNAEKRQEMLTFVVAGGGFTGVEMIGELAEWKEELCENYYIDPKEVKLYVVDMLPTILKVLPEKLIRKAEKRLRKMGVEIITGTAITCVGEDYVCMDGKDSIPTRTVIWTTGVEGSDVVGEMEIEQKARKRIVTNEKLQSTDYKNVYIVGDNMFYIPEGEDCTVPQMVENCEHAAPVIAHNIYTDIKGGSHKSYKPQFHGVMVCIGGRYGVAHVGMPDKKICLPSFFAMFVKHFINVIYFFQVLGWNKIYSYALHEFFNVKNRRSFVGGHFAKRSPNFWLVPLRMFVGVKWFLQGFEKLPKIIKDPNEIFLFTLPSPDGTSGASQAAESTADATAAASQAAEAASEWGEAIPVPEFISGIVDWSMGVFIAPIAPLFQAFMVLAEIGVGLALVFGLLTAPAAAASVALCVMIYFSGMAPYEIMWYAAAGIALIGGSGSTFGLDYYVLPWLKKQWKKIGFVRKWYLYND